MYDLMMLYMMGFILAVFTGMHMPGRFSYVYSCEKTRPRILAFLTAFLVAGLGWGVFNKIPLLNHLYIAPGNFGIANVIMLSLIGCGLIALVIWHFVYAYQHNDLKGFILYLSSRVVVYVFYMMYFYVSTFNDAMYIHVHHYLIAWMCALFAEFNHPISLLLLGIATGIFVQGISAFDADPHIYYHHARPKYPPFMQLSLNVSSILI